MGPYFGGCLPRKPLQTAQKTPFDPLDLSYPLPKGDRRFYTLQSASTVGSSSFPSTATGCPSCHVYKDSRQFLPNPWLVLVGLVVIQLVIESGHQQEQAAEQPPPHRQLSLDDAIEYLSADELLEAAPLSRFASRVVPLSCGCSVGIDRLCRCKRHSPKRSFKGKAALRPHDGIW